MVCASYRQAVLVLPTGKGAACCWCVVLQVPAHHKALATVLGVPYLLGGWSVTLHTHHAYVQPSRQVQHLHGALVLPQCQLAACHTNFVARTH